MKKINWVAASAFFLLFVAPYQQAHSESANAALKAIGLMGTWSPDCSAEASAGAQWTTFSIPLLGSAIVESHTLGSHTTLTVLSAQRITETKIDVITQVTAQEFLNEATGEKSVGRKIDTLWEKLGDHFKIQRAKTVGGDTFIENGQMNFGPPSLRGPSPLNERCLNK